MTIRQLISRPSKTGRLFFLACLLFLSAQQAAAHQAPYTIVLLDVNPGSVAAELQLPLPELELSFGHDITKDPEHLVEMLGPQLKEYLLAHIHPYVNREEPWKVEVSDMRVDKGVLEVSGPPFYELVVHLVMTPPKGVSTRSFVFDYDVIVHQVINHTAFVSVRNDWERGISDAPPAEAGIIRWDTRDNVIYPLKIALGQGSTWTGFRSMVSLGMAHIKEGTDHLMFLLVLLLPATLVAARKRWDHFGGVRYSLLHILRVVTAFTIGHSITLLLGATGWVRVPFSRLKC
jgi:hypothetical protein